jgi:hypothetical protein
VVKGTAFALDAIPAATTTATAPMALRERIEVSPESRNADAITRAHGFISLADGIWRARQGSNSHLRVRSAMLYPLSYGRVRLPAPTAAQKKEARQIRSIIRIVKRQKKRSRSVQ